MVRGKNKTGAAGAGGCRGATNRSGKRKGARSLVFPLLFHLQRRAHSGPALALFLSPVKRDNETLRARTRQPREGSARNAAAIGRDGVCARGCTDCGEYNLMTGETFER